MTLLEAYLLASVAQGEDWIVDTIRRRYGPSGNDYVVEMFREVGPGGHGRIEQQTWTHYDEWVLTQAEHIKATRRAMLAEMEAEERAEKGGKS